MKNKSKGKFLILVLVICTLSMTIMQVGASRNGTIIGDINEAIVIDDIGTVGSVTFYHSENIPLDIARQIEKSMLTLDVSDNSGDVMMQSFSILCIFGHNWSTGATIIVQHGAYSTVPRCREIWRSTEFCTRCNVTIIFSESHRRIWCC